MSLPLEDTISSQSKAVMTVSQFSQALQKNLQDTMPFVWISGELSSVFHAQSGHVYATIKDATSQMKMVVYQFVRKAIPFDIHDGLHVNIGVQPTVYKPRGELQLIVKAMEPEGLGALQLAFEQLKAKLEAEGLFHAKHKKLLPAYPKAIGVITSKDGAVLHDILRVVERRYPIAPIILYPCSVQGGTSVKEIASQLELAATEQKADVYILARGGGSLTDLWSFNSEEVVRAIFQFPFPLISAIGHETDFTLADFVADVRAPTPSIAAELATPSIQEIYQRLDHAASKLFHHINFSLRQLEHRCDKLEQSWGSPTLGLSNLIHRVEKSTIKLQTQFDKILSSHKHRLATQDFAFRAFAKKISQNYLQIEYKIKQIAQNHQHFLNRYFHKMNTNILTFEGRLLQADPHNALLPISIVGESGHLIKSALSIRANTEAILGFPDGKWKIIFKESIEP